MYNGWPADRCKKTTARSGGVVGYGYRKISCMTQPYSSTFGNPRLSKQYPTMRGVYNRRSRARRLAQWVSNSHSLIRFANSSFESKPRALRITSLASVQRVALRASSSLKRLLRSSMKLHNLSSDSRRKACIGVSMGLEFVKPNKFRKKERMAFP